MDKAVGSYSIATLPEIGADIARFGDDRTAIHTRWGSLSLSHESRQGFGTMETTGWIIEVATRLAAMVNDLREKERNQRPLVTARQIPLKVDDDGVGGGVVDRLREQGMNVIAVRSGSTPREPSRYPNRRSELWFQTVERARDGNLGFCAVESDGVIRSKIDPKSLAELRVQALRPMWKMDSAGRRVVEKKSETKARLGHSPDDMDAVNLAYYEATWEAPQVLDSPAFDKPLHAPVKRDDWDDQQAPAGASRRLFGGR